MEINHFELYFGTRIDKGLLEKVDDVRPEDFESETVYCANGFRIMDMGAVKSCSEIDSPLHVLLLLKNETGQKVMIDCSAVAVNRNVVKMSTVAQIAPSNGYGLIDIALQSSSLRFSIISEVEVHISIKNEKGKIIDNPKLVLDYNTQKQGALF